MQLLHVIILLISQFWHVWVYQFDMRCYCSYAYSPNNNICALETLTSSLRLLCHPCSHNSIIHTFPSLKCSVWYLWHRLSPYLVMLSPIPLTCFLLYFCEVPCQNLDMVTFHLSYIYTMDRKSVCKCRLGDTIKFGKWSWTVQMLIKRSLLGAGINYVKQSWTGQILICQRGLVTIIQSRFWAECSHAKWTGSVIMFKWSWLGVGSGVNRIMQTWRSCMVNRMRQTWSWRLIVEWSWQ